MTISQALHSYFAVSDVRQARVEGVDGLGYIETLAGWEQRQQQGALTFAGETDRIYLNTRRPSASSTRIGIGGLP